jgi:phosphate:Na+ symporter
LTSTVADEMTAYDDGSAALLMALTSDRSALMAGLRETLWQRAPDLSAAERQLAWDTTDAFEQMVWLLNRYAVSLSPAATGT